MKESARSLAVDILCRVESDETYANLLLNQRLRTVRLGSSDAGFLTELVSGTLRERMFYDAVIERVAGRSIETIDELTRNILRTGAHQLLTLNTSAHAAVNESVNLQRNLGKQSAAGFVNGVLRAISRADRQFWMSELLEDARDEDTRLSIEFSHPAWIVRALRDALRAESREHELMDLLATNNANPKVNLAILPGATLNDQELAKLYEEGVLVRKGPSPLGLELSGGNPTGVLHNRNLADEEELRVQDQGSQIAALALIRAPVLSNSSEQDWLDLCAGPGGKTAILAAAAREQSVHVRAIEPVEHRAKLVQQAVRANHSSVSVHILDGTHEEAFDGKLFDRILVDAPCTGLGALRRRPEARLRKKVSDVAQLSLLQSKLLGQALDHLKPGGVVAYVTCSPHLAETRVIVNRALKEHDFVEEIDVRQVLHGLVRQPIDLAGGHLSAQLWPHRHETDAMFIALLRRRVNS